MSVYHQYFDRDKSQEIKQSGGAWYNNKSDFIRGVKKVNKFVKKNDLITKLKGATDAVGLTPAIDAYTRGLYSAGAEEAMQAGYGCGCRKQKGGKGRGKPGRPRKVGRPKKK
jgi:hypothetical protein